ncbi:hypothetical protein ACHAXR_006445 [Thalassiosira sp. AJA248-18]
MPRTSSKATAKKSSAKTNKKPAAAKKQPAKSKIISHTDDGTAIVNATMAQIRKGLNGKATQQLVRIPQVAERSKFYAEAAEVIGERESLALPYHGGRMWKCEIKVSDGNGAYGDNRRGKASSDDDEAPPKNRSSGCTPLFRWYRGNLVLATLPYILEDIVEVDCKLPGKKRWANGMSDDEGLDSSDEEWDDEKYQVEPATKMTMEISALTTSAYEDSSHPMPHISRSWISPDLQRFQSRKSAMAHADVLVKRDLLIDRNLYGYGHNGVRLRPVKPTRKQALEAGMVRFLRDGLWIVGQEEMWIEKRRDILLKKQEKRLLKTAESDDEEEGDNNDDNAMATEEEKSTKVEVVASLEGSDKASPCEEKKGEVELIASVKAAARAAAGYVHPELDAPANKQSDINDSKPSAKTVSPVESDASTEGATKSPEQTITHDDESSATQKAIVKRAQQGTRAPPTFTPSTHYRLNQSQIDKCFSACIEHYENVMHTVKARSLHHELSDGFDVFRERGRGRYDMELPLFDMEAFSFLTDPRKASWMPIVHKILGDDATLVHKGCFLSLPGSETQVYHQDGVHLNKKTHKPCYAINVFIPLVDYDMSNGPTEFCLGTHYLGYENFVKEQAYTPCVTAGTPVIFDYRLGHRGLRNYSQGIRPVVYLTYSSVASGKEFRDSVNFSRKRYRKLGDFAEKPLSREERAQKRRRQEK